MFFAEVLWWTGTGSAIMWIGDHDDREARAACVSVETAPNQTIHATMKHERVLHESEGGFSEESESQVTDTPLSTLMTWPVMWSISRNKRMLSATS